MCSTELSPATEQNPVLLIISKVIVGYMLLYMCLWDKDNQTLLNVLLISTTALSFSGIAAS